MSEKIYRLQGELITEVPRAQIEAAITYYDYVEKMIADNPQATVIGGEFRAEHRAALVAEIERRKREGQSQ